MSLEKIIERDITTAMREKTETKLEALRTIKTAIQIEKAKDGKELSDDNIVQIVQKLVNQRTESMKQYMEGNRKDLADHELLLCTVFKSYLPTQLSKEDTIEAIKKIITETEASSIKDMGKVMNMLRSAYPGQLDTKEASQIVKEILTYK